MFYFFTHFTFSGAVQQFPNEFGSKNFNFEAT